MRLCCDTQWRRVAENGVAGKRVCDRDVIAGLRSRWRGGVLLVVNAEASTLGEIGVGGQFARSPDLDL